MSESIDLTNLPKRKQCVTLTERQLREEDLGKRIAELEQQLAEAQTKAELWDKVKVFFSREWKPIDNTFIWIFQRRLPAKNPDTIEDAVRRLV